MDFNRSIALVGRPNVGKSRLFNRLAGRRIAIVHDQPGVTRDLNAVEIDHDYTLMDTGGMGLYPDKTAPFLLEAIEEQIAFAIEAAEIILFVVDGSSGCVPMDEQIAEKLRRFGKEPILVVNKIDIPEHEERCMGEFDHLGIAKTFLLSAEHGRGIKSLEEEIRRALGPPMEGFGEREEGRIKICFAGRPNVGKSSLCNSLLNSERLIVNEVPGTTRDAVELDLDFRSEREGEWLFRLMDTAGVRRPGKMSSSVEYFSSLRSRNAMEKADIVFLVLDARSGVTRQDKTVAGQILKLGRALAVVVNKWDLALELFERDPPGNYKDEAQFRAHFSSAVGKELFFMPESPVLFVSALKGHRLSDILSAARKLEEMQNGRLATPRVNRLLQRVVKSKSPRLVKGKRFKIYYALNTGNKPYRVRIFCNEKTRLEDPYRRYLERSFIREFGLRGCPIHFELVGKPARGKKYFTPQKTK